ncbi:TetR/AcrR family transcriptional regulator [Actinomadura oligospora]|uniref:TetR/AcrR family transcriptional regulator n=1 Tax=Actinomadura oligospora TaxID=111804 RepID=UPI0004B11BD4|nr:TetR/AcrR family transcriptional regulator [Actinomadura oligospora]
MTVTASRRRGEELRRAILDAVVEQLDSVGYAKLSTNKVAAAAGTGKAALYRRWRNKEELVRDALRDLLPEPPDLPDGTPLRDGLVALLRHFDHALNDSRGTAFQTVAAEAADGTGELRTLFHESVTRPCEERIADLVRRHGGTASASAASAGPALLFYYCVAGQPRRTDAEIQAIADDVLLPLFREGGSE